MTAWLVIGAIYLIGAYVAAFISGYFDYEPLGAATAFWPFYVAAWLVIAAIMPFIWIALLLYRAGAALRGKLQ